MPNNHCSVSWALGLFFGWLLSFPFNGPAISFLSFPDYAYLPYSTFFIITHALSLVVLAVIPPEKISWQKYMPLNAIICLAATIILVFPQVSGRFELVALLFCVMGIASACFILGWCLPYTLLLPGPDRMRFMALVIVKSNLIYLVFNLVGPSLPEWAILAFLAMPLAGAAWTALKIDSVPLQINIPGPSKPDFGRFAPGFLVLLCLFVFVIYVNAGLIYSIIYPTFSEFEHIYQYFRSLPSILVLMVFVLRIVKSGNQSIVYLGISLLGFAFIFFALMPETLVGYFITEILFQSSFALMDLFLWVILGELALFYSHPYRVFGWGLAANVGAIFVGILAGSYFLQTEETYFMLTALFAFAAIFLTLLIMPPLFRRMDERPVQYSDVHEDIQEDNWEVILKRAVDKISGSELLTSREKEIVKLILQGDTNRDIATHLFISENTLKTHIRNIYRKLKISQKRELLSLALGRIKTTEEQEVEGQDGLVQDA